VESGCAVEKIPRHRTILAIFQIGTTVFIRKGAEAKSEISTPAVGTLAKPTQHTPPRALLKCPFPATGPIAGPQDPCSVLPAPNSKEQPVILCPDPMSVLPDGLNQVEWQIHLMDGTTLDKVTV
jgi:hypothetical protein